MIANPLAVFNGQIEAIGDRKTSVKWLNFGPAAVIPASETITATQTLLFISAPPGQRVDVVNILGGEQGDLLIVFGNNIRLQSSGNIDISSNNLNIDFFDNIVFIFGIDKWREIGRTNN